MRGQEIEAKTGVLQLLKNSNSEHHPDLSWRWSTQFLGCQSKVRRWMWAGLWKLPGTPDKTEEQERHATLSSLRGPTLSLQSVPFPPFLSLLVNSCLLLSNMSEMFLAWLQELGWRRTFAKPQFCGRLQPCNIIMGHVYCRWPKLTSQSDLVTLAYPKSFTWNKKKEQLGKCISGQQGFLPHQSIGVCPSSCLPHLANKAHGYQWINKNPITFPSFSSIT